MEEYKDEYTSFDKESKTQGPPKYSQLRKRTSGKLPSFS